MESLMQGEGRWVRQKWKQKDQLRGYFRNPGERLWQLGLGRQQRQWGEEGELKPTYRVWQIKSTGPICLGNDGIKEIP